MMPACYAQATQPALGCALPAALTRSRGFSLVEVLLAIVLLALLLSGIYGAVSTANRAIVSGEDLIDRTNRLRSAQEFIRRQISRSLPLQFGADETSGSIYVFEGDAEFVRFVAPMPGYLSHGGPYVQTLELADAPGGGKQLLFTHHILNGFELDKLDNDDVKPELLIDQIVDGKFEYRALDENGKLGDWDEEWETPSQGPLMMRITLEMSEKSKLVWPVMDIALVIDPSTVRRALDPAGFFPGG